MTVGSLRTRGLSTTHLDPHLLHRSGRNDEHNINPVRILQIGLTGPKRNKPFPLKLSSRPGRHLHRHSSGFSSSDKSSRVRMEPTGTGQSFSFPLESSAHLKQQRLVRIFIDRIVSFGRNANLSSAFSSVEPDSCEGTTTINRNQHQEIILMSNLMIFRSNYGAKC